jgi:OFA family oxalate/formate antiporter-like MFS transporter
MDVQETDLKDTSSQYGWVVTFAGIGINLALGILYTWSVISKSVPAEWGWSEMDKSWPYSIACLVFCLVMVPAGRMQDKFGPRIVASIGGILVGIGMIMCSTTTSPMGFILWFGVLAGAGIGFGYASATPPAIKWFPPAKTGLIAGLVVSGFGLASVYAAPLTKSLVGKHGLPSTMLYLGAAFLVVVVVLAQFIRPPHKVIQFAKEVDPNASPSERAVVKKEDYTPSEMLKTWQFYPLWFMYACGSGAGLMVISKLAAIASKQAQIQLGFVLVAVLAIGNGGGRIAAGILSDRIGRKATMFSCFVLQALLVFTLSKATTGSVLATVPALSLLSALIGANYGANLSLFPSITKDYYGLKNFGMNYGLMFTSWGVGGFMLALAAGKMYDKYQSFSYAYYGAAVLLILAAIVTFSVRPPQETEKEVAAA